MSRIDDLRKQSLNNKELSDKYKKENIEHFNSTVNVIGAVFGTIHTGLTLAAEAVACGEAKLVEKVSKGNLKYDEYKAYRTVTTQKSVYSVKANLVDAYLQSKARAEKLKESLKKQDVNPKYGKVTPVKKVRPVINS